MPIETYKDLSPVNARGPSPFTGSGIYPNSAWTMAWPILVYGDYLFRRIAVEGGMAKVSEVIVSGLHFDPLFGEMPNVFLTLALCMPFAVAAKHRIGLGEDISDLQLDEIAEIIMFGKLEWSGHDPHDPRAKEGFTLEMIEKSALCFSFIPFLYRTFPGLSEDSRYVRAFEENSEYHQGLDFSNRIRFRILSLGWSRFVRKI